MAKKQETEIMDLSKFRSEYLPELQGKKETITEVIKANPIKDVEDNASYEEMKKSRTAVKTLRTGLERESKEVISKLKVIVIDSVKKEYDLLITDVKCAEDERQAKVDAWEEKKEQERQEKLRLEQERIDSIKTTISDYVASWKEVFDLMKVDKVQEVSENFHESNKTFDKISLQEFDVLFDREVLMLSELLDSKIKTLLEQEQIRIENLLIQEKNDENNKITAWRHNWYVTIDTLSISDVANLKEKFSKSKLTNLKHYVSGYEEIYTSTEKRLSSQIEFVSKAEEQRIAQEKFSKEQAEIAENNRIAQEKFEKEKKEFEQKQAEAKFQGRVKQLTDLGFVLNEGNEAYQKGLHYLNLEDIKLANDEMWFRELEDAKNVKDFSELETVDASDNQNYHEEDVDVKGITVENPIIFDVLFENIQETWNSIYDEFEKDNTQDEYDDTVIFVSWLEKYFNVPSRKQ